MLRCAFKRESTLSLSGESTNDRCLSHREKCAPLVPTLSDCCQQKVEKMRTSHSPVKILPRGDGNGSGPVCAVQTYCFARNLSRLARSRFHGRMNSFAASGSKAELFEDGDKLRGEAVDNEEDALAKRFSRGRLNAVDTDDQLCAAERLDVTSLRFFNS